MCPYWPRHSAFEVGVDRGALPAAHETTLRGATATEALREHDDVPDRRLGKDALERREAARKAIEAATRAGTSRAELERYGQSAKGMRIDLGVLRPPSGSTSRRRAYEVKTTAFCASHYQVREHTGGLTWADFRARETVRERGKQAAHIDVWLFRGIQPAPMAGHCHQRSPPLLFLRRSVVEGASSRNGAQW